MSDVHPALVAVLGFLWTGLAAPTARGDQILFEFGPGFDVKSVEARDARVALAATPGAAALRIATGHANPWPGITLKAPQGPWDLSRFQYLAIDVKNVGSNRVEVSGRVDSPGTGTARWSVQDRVALAPGETKTLRVWLQPRMPEKLASKFFGMRGNPGGLEKDKGIDVRRVDQVLVFVAKPTADHVFEISRVRAAGTAEPLPWLSMDEKKLFPMIDRYGQFIHKDWPGKIRSDDDLKRRREAEAAELAAQPGPADWNQYGGWKAGPQLKATGFFRTEKHQGKWWLVDPEGRLFWSHGVDCVRGSDITPITDRRHWFQELPEPGSPLAKFYGRGAWAPHGYYQGKPYETFAFAAANRFRKYGDDFERQFAEIAHRRLRSWAMNTIGNWSAREVYLLRKTPYVATVQSGRRPIEGSAGYWGKFPDPFDPDFERSVRRHMEAEKGATAGDPWCLGYFIDNELSWGDELSLSTGTLASPPEQPAKQAFVADLKTKYGSIEKLNQAWGTQHASWEALAASRNPPDPKKARDDLAAFYTRIAEQYFRLCREAVKAAAPNQLYLGCRFAWVNDRAVRAAAKYCDVVSFNAYRRSIAEHRLPDGIDLPVIIGEFHFGALDRGMFHPGLVKTANQEERAAAYAAYVRSGLSNPCIVGTHWFQFGDQATTGRGDGENYQIGLVDICDTPYPETIQAVRDVGRTMYRYRIEAK